MNRLVQHGGTLLMIAGVLLLAFVGVSYARQHFASVPGWDSSAQKQGQQIASRQNKVSLPSRLKNGAKPGSDPATRLVIPSIGVDSPVVQTPPVNGTWNVADWAIGHLTTSPNPGAKGNAAYSAHDDIMGEIFKRLDELKPGASMVFYTSRAVYTYAVDSQVSVDPSDVAVLNPTARPTVTLITCTPYWVDTQRLIVKGVLKSVRAV